MTLTLKILQSVTILVCTCSFTFFSNTTKISQKDAIRLAEDFVKYNGYTKLPADSSRLSFELFDNLEKSKRSILKMRHNTLKPKAFCILRDGNEWHIGFLYSEINVSKLNSQQLQSDLPGRAIIVNDNGEIRIAHKEPSFSKFIKL